MMVIIFFLLPSSLASVAEEIRINKGQQCVEITSSGLGG